MVKSMHEPGCLGAAAASDSRYGALRLFAAPEQAPGEGGASDRQPAIASAPESGGDEFTDCVHAIP